MDRIQVTAPLQISGNPPQVNEDEVDEVTAMLSGRQIWLAAHVQLDELPAVLAAHAKAQRLWHRLLLVLVPAAGTPMAQVAKVVSAHGMRHINWDEGDDPDEFCQVVLTEGDGGLGLWYRMAPVCFLGSSLTQGHGGSNPFDAAALGSAVLYGPNIRDHLATYSRLAGAGAARIVKDGDGLGAGVARLIAPDHAAMMALAAWEVVSEGSQVTDHLLDLLHDYLDRKAED
jgi:3-deoxy-D-manno-octulosonic-acid transferase